MDSDTTRPTNEEMKALIEPWYQALSDPARAQDIVLARLLKGYNQTEYGRNHNSERVGSYADFKQAFPVSSFEDFKPFLDQVMAGNFHALLSEEPVAIALTKGTTGKSKFIPYTSTHVNMFTEYSYRSRYIYTLSRNNFDWMSGYRLNLVSSPNLGKMKVGEKELTYGYSMAVLMTYTEAVEKRVGVQIIPAKAEMDRMPKEPSKTNWEARYELGYQQAREQNVTSFSTMPTIALGFGRYLHQKHHILPKDLWQISYMPIGGYPGIHTRLAPVLRSLYGKSLDIREGYISTEACFGVHTDDKKAWSPLYDYVFFEVETIHGVKPMHEMTPGEIGALIVSTPDFPRYRIGDLILAFEPPYFRCIGRENTKIHPYNFGKLTGKSYFTFHKPTDLDSWR